MDGPEITEAVRARRLKRVAITAGIALVIFMVLAVSIYLDVFVILSPMTG